jgi:hypothetical protein
MSKRTYWHIQGTRHEFPDYHVMKVMTLEQLLDDLALPFDQRRLRHCGWWPQSSFICNGDDNVCVDHVLRQESLQRDLDHFLERLGLPKAQAHLLNRSEPHITKDEILTRPNLLSTFVEIYRRDYQSLNYSLPTITQSSPLDSATDPLKQHAPI